MIPRPRTRLFRSLLTIAALGCASLGFAQQQQWVQNYVGPLDDVANAIAVDGAGNVYVAGYTTISTGRTQALLVKYDPMGRLMWVQRYGDYSAFRAIAVDGGGNAYVAGVFNNYALLVMKFLANGSIGWIQGGQQTASGLPPQQAITLDPTGYVIVATTLYSGSPVIFVEKMAPTGQMIFAQYLTSGYAVGVGADQSGVIYLAGTGMSSEMVTMRVGPFGGIQWMQRWGVGSGGHAKAMAVDAAGNVTVTGSFGYPLDYYTIRYAPWGALMWVARYNGPANGADEVAALALDRDGSTIVTGRSWGSGGYNWATVKYAANSAQLWVRQEGGSSDNGPSAIAIDGAGNCTVTGWTTSPASSDYVTERYDRDGHILWGQAYDGPARSTDRATAIALDAAGAVHVTGLSYGISTGYDIATIKYIQAPVNNPPVATDDAYTVNQNTTLAVPPPGVLANDSDLDGDPLTAMLVSGPSTGTVSLNPSGDFVYTPAVGFFGDDSLTYVASDTRGGQSNVATVRITVVRVLRPPIAASDAYGTREDMPLVVPAPGVLANDSDPDGDAISAILETPPQHGSLDLGSDGSLTFVPNPDWWGPDAFAYRAGDGALVSDIASVTIYVAAVNDPPIASDQALSTPEDQGVAITLAGSDIDGDTLSYTIQTTPQHGSLEGAPPNVMYQPEPNWNGADSFQFSVNDGTVESNPATVGIMVEAINDPPSAENIDVVTREDTRVAIRLLGGDLDGDPITFEIDGQPSQGRLEGAPPELIYYPNPNFNGSDRFTYHTFDGVLRSPASTVSITVTPVNDPPVALPHQASTLEDTPLSTTLSGSDVDGDALTFEIVMRPAHGTLVMGPVTGVSAPVTYTPEPNYFGTDGFAFRVNDGQADSAVANVTLSIASVNDPPVADGLTVSTRESQSVAFVLTGSDVEGDALTFSVTRGPGHGELSGTPPALTYAPSAGFSGTDSFAFVASDGMALSAEATVTINITPNIPPVAHDVSLSVAEDSPGTVVLSGEDAEGDPLSYHVMSQPAHGVLACSGATCSYVPAPDFNGTDLFTYRVNDGLADSNIATVSVIITPVNDPPRADPQSATLQEDTVAVISLSGVDVDGDALSFSIVSQPALGTVALASGTATYTPTPNAHGTDGFIFSVSDGMATSDAPVSITIEAVNDAPVANGQSATTAEDVRVPITLSASDVDGDTLAYALVDPPAHGTLVGLAPNLTYEPAADYAGADGFTFRVSDGQADSAVASVALTVTPLNDAPVCSSQTISTQTGVPIAINLEASDVDGDALAFSVVTLPQHGTLANTPGFTYTPAAGYTGPDSFTFKASDGQLDSNVATVNIMVTPAPNSPPDCSRAMAFPAVLWPPKHKLQPVQVLGVTDPDGDSVIVRITAIRQDEPTNGLGDGDASPDATLSPAQVRAERSGAGNGRMYHVSFTASDGHGGSSTGEVTVCVPHDAGASCLDEGSLFDSTLP